MVVANSSRVRAAWLGVLSIIIVPTFGQSGAGSLEPAIELAPNNAMANPYRMLENWPHLGNIPPGAAIGIVPDGKGGVWLQHRSVPGILHIDASGNILKQFDATFSS